MYDLPVTFQDVNHPRRKRMGRDWPLKPTIRELECVVRHYGVFRGQTFADVIDRNQQRRFGYFRFAKKSSAAI